MGRFGELLHGAKPEPAEAGRNSRGAELMMQGLNLQSVKAPQTTNLASWLVWFTSCAEVDCNIVMSVGIQLIWSK
jgi:hypothetical protein